MKKLYVLIFLMTFIINIFAEKIDFVVAKVGRDIILYSDLQKQINQIKSAKMWNDQMDNQFILKDMIENKLIVQKARELNIKIDEKRITDLAENQLNQVKAQFSNEDEFFKELRNAGILQSDLKKYYQEMITENMLKEELIRTEIRNKININDSDIYDYYTTYSDSIPLKPVSYEISMILRIPSPSDETQQNAYDKISLIQKKLNQGEDFALLAEQYSECPSSKVGGDLNYFTRGMMVKEFEDAAFKLQINQISPIVKTSFGYHIIKVTDKRDNEVRASHILIMLAESEEDIQREKEFTNDLYLQLQNGATFDSLATIYSHDTESKDNNGIIGVLSENEFPAWFKEEISKLDIGNFTDVLKYQNMFYIFKKNKEFAPRPMEFDEVKANLKEILFRDKQMQLYEEWMDNLKNEIYVHIYKERLNVTE
ncbi:MAG: peptidylprolyl isomerase [Candidatus Cloacimonetes bacterium]|nr:peptidylprolyl isomerase [Candidatus Cloacimonadota bacterium]